MKVLASIFTNIVLMLFGTRVTPQGEFIPQSSVVAAATFHGLSFVHGNEYTLEKKENSITIYIDPGAADLTIARHDIRGFSKEQIAEYHSLADTVFLGDCLAMYKQECDDVIAGRAAFGKGCVIFLDGYPFYHVILTFNTDSSLYKITYMCSMFSENASESHEAFVRILNSITID